MYQDMIQKNAEIEGKFGLQVNEQQIRAEQERQRMMMQQQR
jgi:lipase chaperone LimK